MRIFINNILLLLILCTSMTGHAGPKPPAPALQDTPPTGPPLPIDQNLTVLLFTGIIFGIYIIYNHKLKQERPA